MGVTALLGLEFQATLGLMTTFMPGSMGIPSAQFGDTRSQHFGMSVPHDNHRGGRRSGLLRIDRMLGSAMTAAAEADVFKKSDV